MSIFQIVLMFLAISATIYQFAKVIWLHAYIVNKGSVVLANSWYFWVLGAVCIQVAFVVSLTGVS